MNAITEATVWNVLRQVIDPEIGCNIVDLGLVYSIAITGGKVYSIRWTAALADGWCENLRQAAERYIAARDEAAAASAAKTMAALAKPEPAVEAVEVVDVLAGDATIKRAGERYVSRLQDQSDKEFAAYVAQKHAVAVNSCTAALHLALEAIGLSLLVIMIYIAFRFGEFAYGVNPQAYDHVTVPISKTNPSGPVLLSYVALKDKQWVIIVDGEEQARHEGIVPGSFVFSPDNQHLAYSVSSAGSMKIAVDGLESSSTYDGFFPGSKLVFDDATHLHTLAVRQRARETQIYRVDMEIVPE